MRSLGFFVVAVLAGAAGGFLVAELGDGSEPTEALVETIDTATSEVLVTDLVQTETLQGELRFADQRVLLAQMAGTITAVGDPGDVVRLGDLAYEIDGGGVIVIEGERPQWRPFIDGMDDGDDVLQLETYLAGAGYEIEEPDNEFDDETLAAIEAWQEDRGVEVTGSVPLGGLLFVETGFRIGEVFTPTATPVAPGVAVYRITSRAQEVVIELDPRDLDLVSEGSDVTVTLPSGDVIPGVITEIGAVVRRVDVGPDAPNVLDVTVSVDTTDVDLERAPVDVEVESDRASGVLAVPVRALITLSDGGYAVQVDTGGDIRLVGVTIGDFADGLVEVDGALAEGDLVVVPLR